MKCFLMKLRKILLDIILYLINVFLFKIHIENEMVSRIIFCYNNILIL